MYTKFLTLRKAATKWKDKINLQRAFPHGLSIYKLCVYMYIYTTILDSKDFVKKRAIMYTLQEDREQFIYLERESWETPEKDVLYTNRISTQSNLNVTLLEVQWGIILTLHNLPFCHYLHHFVVQHCHVCSVVKVRVQQTNNFEYMSNSRQVHCNTAE